MSKDWVWQYALLIEVLKVLILNGFKDNLILPQAVCIALLKPVIKVMVHYGMNDKEFQCKKMKEQC